MKRSLRFGFVGNFQSGKSTLINCLLKRPIARVGKGSSTTHTIVNYLYAESEYIEIIPESGLREIKNSIDLNGTDTRNDIKEINIYLNNDFLKGIVLTDMPGFGFNEKDNKTAETTILSIDYAVVVLTNTKAIEEESPYCKDIKRLKSKNIPYYIILNCSDFTSLPEKWFPSNQDNIDIAHRDRECIDFHEPLKYPFNNNEIPIVNLMWYWFALTGENDTVVNRYKDILYHCGLLDSDISKSDIIEASGFEIIKKIFDMDNRAYLELRKDFKEEIQKLKEELCPVGTIQAFAFPNIPVGWLACNGQSVEIAAYPELYHAIGITFGGDGETIFALPDLRNRFVRGWDREGENAEKRDFGSRQEDALQNHGHKSFFSENTTSENGSHSHTIKYEEESYGYGGVFSSTYHMKRITETDYMVSYVHGMSACLDGGSHKHTLPRIKTEEVIDLNKSKVRFSNETRPKNIALLYCIKAENLCSADTSTESGYSTIVEKVKKEMAPLCETLPVVEIGGGEYLVNIESIKESHFCNHPNCRQELVYLTAKCFKDICVYNSRLGLREEGFDEFGLDLLVSWMIDKEMVEKEEKLLFIGEVKHYIMSFLSNVSPMQ